MKRIKGYLEYKLDLELCGVNTFEKDHKIRDIPTSDTNETTKTTNSTDLLEYKKGKKV